MPERVVVIEFDSVEKAVAVHDGPAYQAALKALGNGVERDRGSSRTLPDASAEGYFAARAWLSLRSRIPRALTSGWELPAQQAREGCPAAAAAAPRALP